MKQIEATAIRPFYSVGYQYEQNPWTIYSRNEFWRVLGNDKDRVTMSGTDQETIAKKLADWCVRQPGIKFAWVHKTTDCYNHTEVYKAAKGQPPPT